MPKSVGASPREGIAGEGQAINDVVRAMDRRSGILLVLALTIVLALPPGARAVPSFARQTGLACAACHTAFPELTPFGRWFKLNGYTFSTGESMLPPLAGAVQSSFTHTGTAPKNVRRTPTRHVYFGLDGAPWWKRRPPEPACTRQGPPVNDRGGKAWTTYRFQGSDTS